VDLQAKFTQNQHVCYWVIHSVLDVPYGWSDLYVKNSRLKIKSVLLKIVLNAYLSRYIAVRWQYVLCDTVYIAVLKFNIILGIIIIITFTTFLIEFWYFTTSTAFIDAERYLWNDRKASEFLKGQTVPHYHDHQLSRYIVTLVYSLLGQFSFPYSNKHILFWQKNALSLSIYATLTYTITTALCVSVFQVIGIVLDISFTVVYGGSISLVVNALLLDLYFGIPSQFLAVCVILLCSVEFSLRLRKIILEIQSTDVTGVCNTQDR